MSTRQKQLLSDLDSLIKSAAAAKQGVLKQASIGDDVKDGTSKPQTGERHSENASDAAEGTAAMAAGGAKTNPVGASVTLDASHDAKAAETSGNKGPAAGLLAVKEQGANGSDGTIKGDNKKTASDLVAQLRKAAEPEVKVAAAKPVAAKNLTGHLFKSASHGVAEGLAGFCKAAADAGSPEGDPAAAGGEAAPAPEAGAAPAGPEAGAQGGQPGGDEQAIQQILQAIESGQLSEEDAQKLLEEAAQSGAISPEDLQAAQAELAQAGQGQGQGAPAPGGDAGAGAPPEAAPQGPEAQEKIAMAKIAHAHVGPEHPEYMAKLAALHADDHRQGYEFGMAVAHHLAKLAESAEHEGKESAKVEKAEHDLGIEPKDEAEKKVLDGVKGEMGLNDESMDHLMSAQPKVAADNRLAQFELRVRTAILAKTAALVVAERHAAK